MKAIRFALVSFLFSVFFASLAQAQQRTFVSGLGSDSNPCTRTAPCRTFGQAISVTDAGGEVYVLDTAGYGPFAINKAVSIVAPAGVTAGITVFSGDGVDVNAGASDVVVLRGLTINNQGSSGTGIVFTAGGTLHVENCVVNGFSFGSGISFGSSGKLEVKDSIARGKSDGILILPATGTALAELDHVRLEGNTNSGLTAREGSQVTVRSATASGNGIGFSVRSNTSGSAQLNVRDCVASNSFLDGVLVLSASTGSAECNVESCVLSSNPVGIRASGSTATARLSNSTVTDNSIGLNNNGGPALVLSRGNNTVEGNQTDELGTIGSYSAK